MRSVKIKIRNLAVLFFSLFLTLAVFSQISAANPKPTYDVGLNKADWLYYKTNNDLSAYLGKKSSNLPTVRYQKSADYLEFSMTGVSSTTSVSLETDVKTPNTPILFYRNIFDGADANYQITNIPFRVKEEIALKETFPTSLVGKRADLKFLFSAETSAKPVKQKDGSIVFFDDKGDYLFQLDKPFMVDAKGTISNDVDIEIVPTTQNEKLKTQNHNSKLKTFNKISNNESLISNQITNPNNQLLKEFKNFFNLWDFKNWNLFKNYNLEIINSRNIRQNRHRKSVLGKYQIILTADSAWLNNPSRAYPVIIDPTVTHNADANFTGQMNRIADSDTTSSTQLESSYPEAVKDPYTVLLLHFNEANGTTAGIRDYASTTRVITANGNASTTSSVTQLGLGNSAAFDGNDELSMPNSSDFYLRGNDFTLQSWVYLTAAISGTDYIMHMGGNASDWAFTIDATSGLGFRHYNGAWNNYYVSWSPSVNTWYNLTITRSGNTLYYYVNGSLIGTNSFSATIADHDLLMHIGDYNNVAGNGIVGYLDSLRIIKGRALTPEEIKAAASRRPYAVYTSSVLDASASVAWNTVNWTEGGVNTGNGEQPYNTGSLVAQWDFNDTSGATLTASSSGSCTTACNGTLTNFAYTDSQDQATITTGWTANNKKWGAGALMMESAAAADYVSIADPASNALDPGTGDFTVEGWIKSSTAGQDTIIQNNTTVGACAANAGYILIVNGNRNLAAYASDGTTCFVNNLTANASSTEIADGRWHHFAFVADRDTKAYVYYDGRLATSTTINNTTAANPVATLYMGASGATGDSDFILDSARFYSRALSAAEILSNYQAGNIEIQTRAGATSDPNDGTWEAWKPTTGETQLLNMDSDAANWRSDIMASTTIATSTETTLKMEGTGSLKVKMGMASTTANTVALWHFEETGTTTGTYLYDETANNNDATTTGTTVVDGIFGKARSFNGTSDYVSVADSDNWNFGNGAYSIDLWVKFNSLSGDDTFYEQYISATSYLRFSLNTANTLNIYARDGGTAYANTFISWTPSINTWYHLAVTREAATTQAKLFINGIEQVVSHGAIDSSSIPNYAAPVTIGARSDSTNSLNGIMDSIRIIKGRALSADEIAETYRMGANHHLTRQVSATDLSSANKLAFNVASDRPGTYLEAMLGESDYANYELASSTLALSTTTVLYIKGDEIASSTSIKDSSFSGKAITVNGNARTAGGGKIGNSVYFDGTGDWIDMADSDDWSFGAGEWTIDFWFNAIDAPASTWRYMGGQAISDGTESINTGIFNSKIHGSFRNSGGSAKSINGATTISTGVWYHYALIRTGDTLKLFLNGVPEGSVDTTGFTHVNQAAKFAVGRLGEYTSTPFNGYLDELRIIKGTALTADQIRQAYEYGLRTHPITIDFGATLQTSDLISSATDYNFSLTATTSGLSATTSGLYLGDKIIVKENLGGTEYSAQGTVNAINTATGAITVPSWDTGSTFPAGNGYSPNATVFKWQREYFDLTGAATTTRDAITNLTLRPTNGAEGRTIYLDDFRYNTNYLTASSSSAITSSNNRYLQYRTIFSSWDSFVSPYLSAISAVYSSTANMFAPIIGISGGGFLSF